MHSLSLQYNFKQTANNFPSQFTGHSLKKFEYRGYSSLRKRMRNLAQFICFSKINQFFCSKIQRSWQN